MVRQPASITPCPDHRDTRCSTGRSRRRAHMPAGCSPRPRAPPHGSPTSEAPPLHWATGTSAPCTSLFKPVSVDEPVDIGPTPANTFDPRTLWWRHERLHRTVMRHPGALMSRYATERDATEAAWVADPPTSSDAFKLGDEAEARWLTLVTDAMAAKAAPDGRPMIVRRLWRGWDSAAGLTIPPARSAHPRNLRS
ncbi:MAG: hypothetical protein M5U19_22045 [Microthrixaceae bacterium]|nr:hypothetical protein [Microthrixaceae bacterium]